MTDAQVDILGESGIPIIIRWYASKCAQMNISYSTYAGWDIYTRSVKLDGTFNSGARNILAIGDIYLMDSFELGAYDIIASETRIRSYVNIREDDLKYTRLIAPYITLANWFCGTNEQIRANTLVSTTISELINKNDKLTMPETIYLMDVLYPIPLCSEYGGIKFRLEADENYTRENGGFNTWHAIALGICSEAEAKEKCYDLSRPHTMEITLRDCLRVPPSPSTYSYPDILPKLSAMDYAILLKNKNTAEICDAIRVPFLYFYPDIDVSDIPCLQKLKDVTREGVARMQAQGMPNCHL